MAIVTVMLAVGMPARMAARLCRVSPGFGLEGRRLFGDDEVHRSQQRGQHMVGFDLQMVRLELDRHVAIAQMVGGAQQVVRRAVLSTVGHQKHLLRRGHDPDQRPVLRHQHVTAACHRAARQEHADRATQRIGGLKAALLPHVPIQGDAGRALQQYGRQSVSAGQQLASLQHQNRK